MLDQLLADGRRAAQRLMADTCIVRKPVGQSTDPDTGEVATVFESVYEGACKVQTDGGVGGDNTTTGGVLVEWLQRVDFPWDTQGLEADMVAEITTSADPNLTGRMFRLVSPQSAKTFATAQRWNVKETA